MAYENLPDGWEEHLLEEFVSFTKGFAFKSKDYKKNGRRIVKVSNFTADSIDLNDCVYIDENRSAEFEKYTLKTNDVVIATVGSWPGSPSVVGKVIRVPQKANNSFLNQNAVNVDVKEGFDKKFLYYLLKNYHFKSYIESTARGSANQANITLDSIKKYNFDCPPLAQQQKIASILGSLDDKIELNEQMNKTLEEMGKALFKSWFVDFEPFQDGDFEESELGMIPKGWRVVSLDKIAKKKRLKVKNYDDWKEKKLISLTNMPGFSISIKEYGFGKEMRSNIYTMNEGDILFGSIRPYFGKTGFTPFNGVLAGTVLQFLPVSEIYYEYLLFCLTSQIMIDYAVSCSSGTKMPIVKYDDLFMYQVALPPENILNDFSKITKSFMPQMKSNIQNIHKLQEIRDTLLPKLMSGEVEV